MVKSDLPFGSEFSPSQIDLVTVLKIAKESKGDWRAFEKTIKEKYFASNDTNEYNKGKLANNCKLGLIAYDLIDRDTNLTLVGQHLLDVSGDPAKLYEDFAKHILLNKRGLILVQCVTDMYVSGGKVDLIALREWLAERGVNFPRGGKHASIMRLWLEKAGVFEKDSWRVNERRLQEILGATSEEIENLTKLTKEQIAYVKALANLGGKGPFASNDIEKLATATYGIKFNEKNLPKQVLYPLQETGYIELQRGTKADGRGAKPFLVYPKEKLEKDIVQPILAQIEKQVGDDLRPLLRKSLEEVLEEIESKDKYVKGLALEALAFKLLRLIDLTYIATRLRGTQTGGAEVDLIFEGTRLVFSRWQIQCKNTSVVSLDDVAKEVGLTHALKSNVIVIVSTGKIGPEARTFSNRIMRDSNKDIILVDQGDLARIVENPTSIIDILNREAKNAMKIKKLDLGG